MNARERVQAALNRQPVDRFPVDIWCTPEILAVLKTYYGIENELDLYTMMGVDKIVWLGIEYLAANDDGTKSGRSGSTHFGAEHTMWGVPLKTMDTGVALYSEFGVPPLEGYNTPESLADYPYWPKPDRFDYDGLTEMLKRASERFVTNAPWVSFYEIYCQLRGMEQSMVDLLIAPDLVDAILDRVEQCQTEMMRRLFEQAASYIDLAFISDDMGGQNGPLMSMETWDRFFRDRMVRWCNLIHSYGLKVFYHSDGSCAELVPRLVEVGIDVLNPIQHICPGMDMDDLKEHFGGCLSFHGGVDNQRILPFGSIEDVRKETRRCLETLGRDGTGYICCSCHNIQPGTPVENVLAMVDAVAEYKK